MMLDMLRGLGFWRPIGGEDLVSRSSEFRGTSRRPLFRPRFLSSGCRPPKSTNILRARRPRAVSGPILRKAVDSTSDTLPYEASCLAAKPAEDARMLSDTRVHRSKHISPKSIINPIQKYNSSSVPTLCLAGMATDMRCPLPDIASMGRRWD
jgi:hypothetical protein